MAQCSEPGQFFSVHFGAICSEEAFNKLPAIAALECHLMFKKNTGTANRMIVFEGSGGLSALLGHPMQH